MGTRHQGRLLRTDFPRTPAGGQPAVQRPAEPLRQRLPGRIQRRKVENRSRGPTIFVAITYSFIFGAMFGDVGQGLLLAIGGLILYKVKNMDLAAIIGCAGVFSTIFGFMYGSFFGFEDLIPALWLKPSEAMLLIPGLGNMNTVFVVAIVFGMFLILLTMIFNIINAVRSRDIENIIFSQNAICGLVFYGALTVTILLYITGHALPATVVLVVMFVKRAVDPYCGKENTGN